MEQRGAEYCCLHWFKLLLENAAAAADSSAIVFAAFAIEAHATMAWVSSAAIAFGVFRV